MISLKVNGSERSVEVEARTTLLDMVREQFGLTGAKLGCDIQVCGACTVLVDEQPISSCNYLAWEAHGKSVLTIEGLSKNDVLDPLQEAFVRNIGAQCGFCTPGQIMAAKGLLLANPSPTRQQITEWLSGNICRCGAYPAIVASVQEAAASLPK